MEDFLVHARDRRFGRRSVRLGCEVVRTRDWSLVGRRIVDLSLDGLKVEADGDLTRDEEVQVFFRAPFSPIWVLAEGRVARVIHGRRPGDDGPAYGIALAPLHPKAQRAIAAASRRFPPTLSWRTRRVDWAATVRNIGGLPV
jgi:hypothetical protein